MGIDTKAVLEAAGTTNFSNSRAGGGHCIGVDPYYLTHKAEQLHSQIIFPARINDDMGKYGGKHCEDDSANKPIKAMWLSWVSL